MKKFTKKISVLILSVLCALCLAGGLSACKEKGPIENPYSSTNYKLETPDDGSLPTDHTAIENLGYMAYVLENQPVFHSYAHTSSVAMGFEQITQSWKDYKKQTEIDESVMVCSDISYSSLVKSGTQSCFVGNKDAYMRTSQRPDRDTVATTAKWSTGEPTRYTREQYLTVYGEFSTEMTVYIINEDTVNSASSVTQNADGTYSLNVKLKPEAASYYQYGMATRGSLKGFPEFKRIDLTFTFDSGWKVISTYCEEDSEIAPKALGGMPTDSASITTTTFSYGEENFDNAHFSYFDSYYKQYLGVSSSGEENNKNDNTPEMLDVLGGGFSQVVNPNGNGQQFNLDLTVGNTDYTGKLYAKLASMDDILGTLDVRAEFAKRGSGRQDLYIEFKNGNINAYYGDNFALTANIDAFSTIISQASEFITKFSSQKISLSEIDTYEAEEGGFDFNALLQSIKFSYTDTSATIALRTDNLLGTGIGISAELNFGRTIDKDGSSSYAFSGASIDAIKYDGKGIDLLVTVSPDASGNYISRKPAENPANLSDYAASVFGLLNSNAIKFDIDLDGNGSEIQVLNGVTAKAQAFLALGSDIAAKVDLALNYKDVAVKLSAFYELNIHSGNFGKVYLTLTEVNGNPVSAKIKCDISELIPAVKELVSAINANSSAEYSDSQSGGLAEIVNKVLNLNFSKIIGELYASNSAISVSVDIDEILSAFSVDLGEISIGKAALTLARTQDDCNLSLDLPYAGLKVYAEGSEETLTVPDGENFVDATALINLVTDAVKEGKAIEQSQTVAFDLALTYGKISIAGLGEISWKDGVVLALDATLSYGDSQMPVKVLYDSSAQAIVKLQINGVGMDIYSQTAESYSVQGGAPSAIEEIISVDDLVNYLFKVINKLVISLEDSSVEGVKNLVITYAAENRVVIGANGGFSLYADIQGFDVNVNAKASDGKYIENFTVETKYSSNVNEDIYHFALDLFDTLELKNLLGSKSYQVVVELNSANSDIQVLKDYGVNATATIYYSEEYEHNLLRADLNLNIGDINAKAVLMYYDNALYIELNELNGNPLAIKAMAGADDVYSAVEFIIGYISGAQTTSEAEEKISGVISNLLGFDIKEAITYSKQDGLTANIDYLLNQFGVSASFEIGTVQVTANLAERVINAKANLADKDEWLTVGASPAQVAPCKPAGDYIDLAQLVKIISSAIEEGKAIEEAQTVAFDLALAYGEISIAGLGEISWKNGVVFALDATLSYGNSKMPVKVLYDGIVKLQINGVGIDIYPNTAESYSANESTPSAVEEIISVDDLINYLFKVVNKLVISLEDSSVEGVKNLVITYAAENRVVIGANGGFSLYADIQGFDVNINAKASDEKYIENFTVETKYSSTVNEDIYHFALDLFDTLELKNLLGSKSYQVVVELDSANSDIQILKDYGVNATATLYYSEEYEHNLLRADLNLDIADINAKAVLMYYDNALYIELNELNGNPLAIKAMAGADDVYSAVEFIIGYISGAQTTSEAEEKISGVISNLLGFDIKEALTYSKQDGLTANIDYLLNQFGVSAGFEIGTVNATANLKQRTLNLSANLADKGAWLTVGAQPAQVVPCKPAGEYIDLAQLVKIISSAIEEGKAIEEAQTVAFDLSLTYGEISIAGLGEISWKNGVVLALDATLSYGDSQMPVKLLYNSDEDEQVKLQINGVGIAISANKASESDTAQGGESGAPAQIEEIINIDDLVGYLFNVVNKLVITLEDSSVEGVKNLVITYAAENRVEIGTNGGFSLNVQIKDINLDINAKASDGKYIESFIVETKYNSTVNEDIYHFALDLFDTLELKNLFGSKSYQVVVELNSANSDIQILKDYGVNATATLYYSEEYEHNLLRADLNLDIGDINAKAVLMYYNNALYIELNELNGNPLAIKAMAGADDVYSAVEFIIAYINGAQTTSETEEKISGVISNLLGFDIKQALTYSKQDGLTVNADYLLNQFGVSAGFEIGTVNATANLKQRTLNLSANIAEKDAWLTVNASPAQVAPCKPAGEYVAIFDLLDLVMKAKAEAEEIISGKAISFEITNASVNTDGVALTVNGRGEADWENALMLALDLTFTVSDGEKNDGLEVKVIYDGNSAENAPLVCICINGLAFEIYRSDIDGVKDTVNEIKNAIDALSSKDNKAEESVKDKSNGEGLDLSQILSSENIQLIISKLLGVANKFDLSLGYDNGGVQSLIVKFAESVNLTLSTTSNLAIDASVTGEGAELNFAASVKAVEKVNGEKQLAIKDEIASYISENATPTTGKSFIKAIYDYVFNVIESLSVKEVLGSDTYKVDLVFKGNDSKINELSGVTVNGSLYYTEGLEGDKIIRGKLAEADLDMVIGDFAVNITAIYNAQNIYVQLKKLGTATLDGIKIKASTQDIYSLAEKLVEIISSESVGNVLKNLVGAASASEIEIEEEQVKLSLTKVINGLLTLDFKKAVAITRDNDSGITTATCDIDYILNTVGIESAAGTAEASLNNFTHNLTVSMLNTEGYVWAEFKAEKTERRSYREGWNSDYIDMQFAVKLVSDLYKTVTDENGEIFTLYSFTGNAHILVDLTGFVNLGSLTKINIPLKILTITAGIDQNGDFYFTLIADLDKVKAAGIAVITEDRNISFTYSGGYITLGRNIDRADSEFRVMTMNYFLDNLFDSRSDSPLPWLLGTSSTTWKTIAENVGKSVKVDSGLTKAGEYYLYESLTQPAKKTEFGLYDILNSFCVKAGEYEYEYSVNGEIAAAQILGLTDNYYAFDLNLKNLTNGTITEAYAALLRDDEKGISGIAAKLSIAGILNVTLTLDNYLKGVTDVYGQEKSTLVELSEEEKAKLSENGIFTYYEYDGKDFEEGVEFFTKVENGYEKVDTQNVDFDRTATYYVRENKTYYVEKDGVFALATEEYNAETKYYLYKANGVNDMANSAAPNYFADFKDVINFNYHDSYGEDLTTHTTPIFGCYDSSGSYSPSQILSEVKLTVVSLGGETQTVSLRYGVKVYLRSVFSPVWADDNQIVIYSFSATDKDLFEIENCKIVDLLYGGYGIESLTQDITVYAHAVNSTKVEFFVRQLDGSPVIEDAFGEVSVTGSFVTGDALPDYKVEGYSCLGWYSDEKFENSLTVFDGTVLKIYGLFVVDEEIINGVTYTFDRQEMVYRITAADADKLSALGYTKSIQEGGKTLILENELHGCKVVEIAASAFKATDVKNVVVPENIKKVGAQAFMDNYGMESIAFTADSVYLGGNSLKGDNRYVFYGCSISNGSNDTGLHVYYNDITSEGSEWDLVRDGVNIGRNMMGDKHKTNWSFVKFTVDGTDNLNCLADGFKSDGMTAEDIKSAVIAELNAQSYIKGYINAYEVTVSCGYEANGKINEVFVEIARNNSPYYLVTLNSSISGSVFESDGAENYDGKIFISKDSEVKIYPPDGFEFVSLSADVELTAADGGAYKFTMPAKTLEFSGEIVKKAIHSVTLISAVDFEYDGGQYSAGQIVPENLSEGKQISTPYAQGYYFLGWAYNNGGMLEFTTSTVQYSTYYAVWGVARDEITSVTALTEGKNINSYLSNVSADSNLSEGIYKWYKDGDFKAEADLLTINDTVLYSRMNFKVTYNLSGDYAYYFVNVASSDPKKEDATAEGKTYSVTYTVLEGTAVSLAYTGDDGHKQLTVIIGDNNDTLRVKDRSGFIVYSAGKSQDLNLSDVNAENGWTEIDGVYSTIVSGTLTIQINH